MKNIEHIHKRALKEAYGVLYEFDSDTLATWTGKAARKIGAAEGAVQKGISKIVHKAGEAAGEAKGNAGGLTHKVGEYWDKTGMAVGHALEKGVEKVKAAGHAVAEAPRKFENVMSKLSQAAHKGYELGKTEGDVKPLNLPKAPEVNLKKPSAGEFAKKVVKTKLTADEGTKKIMTGMAKAHTANEHERAVAHAKEAEQPTRVAKATPTTESKPEPEPTSEPKSSPKSEKPSNLAKKVAIGAGLATSAGGLGAASYKMAKNKKK